MACPLRKYLAAFSFLAAVLAALITLFTGGKSSTADDWTAARPRAKDSSLASDGDDARVQTTRARTTARRRVT